TLSTCMYYTGLDPRTMKPVYIPRSPREKAMQRALLQWKKPETRSWQWEQKPGICWEELPRESWRYVL
ncbi:MAG: DUF3362 domain-containing protein, partial [Acidaminococcaceae bacterium]|nr:DUF3362 domain-containing protein [Acidaminococcaceae bacterium]